MNEIVRSDINISDKYLKKNLHLFKKLDFISEDIWDEIW